MSGYLSKTSIPLQNQSKYLILVQKIETQCFYWKSSIFETSSTVFFFGQLFPCHMGSFPNWDSNYSLHCLFGLASK